MTSEKKMYVMIAGKKMYPAVNVARILLGILDGKMSIITKQRVTGCLTYMRNHNYLQPEDYLKIYDGAKELSDAGITIRGRIRYLFLYTKKAIYKVADYQRKESMRQNANRYFVDVEYDQVFQERFNFNAISTKDYILLDGELHFSTECIGKVLGSAEQLKLFTTTREKLTSFSKLLDFIQSIRNIERKIENLIKAHDYISSLDIKDKEAYLKKINDALSDKQIVHKIENSNDISFKQTAAAYTEFTPNAGKEEIPVLTSNDMNKVEILKRETEKAVEEQSEEKSKIRKSITEDMVGITLNMHSIDGDIFNQVDLSTMADYMNHRIEQGKLAIPNHVVGIMEMNFFDSFLQFGVIVK